MKNKQNIKNSNILSTLEDLAQKTPPRQDSLLDIVLNSNQQRSNKETSRFSQSPNSQRKIYVSYEMFQEVIQNIEKRFQKLQERIENNEKLVHLSDKILDMKNINDRSQQADNSSIIDKINKENLKEMEKTQQIQDIGTRVDQIERRIIGMEENLKKFTAESDQKLLSFSKRLNSQFDNFLKTAKERFDQFYEKEKQIKIFIENHSEQMSILGQQLTITKEEYHLSKQDLMDNMRILAINLKEIEKDSHESKFDLSQIKPALKSIEDDLLQILKSNKELGVQLQQSQFFEEEFNQVKEHTQIIMKQLKIPFNFK